MYLIHQDYEEIHTVATSSSFVPFGPGTALVISIPKSVIKYCCRYNMSTSLSETRCCPCMPDFRERIHGSRGTSYHMICM